jgi:colicin import membrane protein
MEGVRGSRWTRDRDGQTWTSGVVISLLFHLILFSLVLFVPESMPTRTMSGPPIYEVDLVEMPSSRPAAASRASVKTPAKEVAAPKEALVARRIAPPPPEKKPVVIGKRVVERKKEEKKEPKKPTKPTVSPSQLIDKAISKIDKKVKSQNTDHLAKAMSQIERRVQTTDTDVPRSGGPVEGIAIRMYQLAVEEQIKSNWSYPVALMDAKKKGMEAIVLVTVRYDGTVIRSSIKKRSASPIFDESVMKAIERSDPLPPFPEGYKRSSDEIEIRFDLSELEES